MVLKILAIATAMLGVAVTGAQAQSVLDKTLRTQFALSLQVCNGFGACQTLNRSGSQDVFFARSGAIYEYDIDAGTTGTVYRNGQWRPSPGGGQERWVVGRSGAVYEAASNGLTMRVIARLQGATCRFELDYRSTVPGVRVNGGLTSQSCSVVPGNPHAS